MAAKRTIRYRGHTIRVWEQSYSIDGGTVHWLGYEPDVVSIKLDIEAADRIAGEADIMAERLHYGMQATIFNHRPRSLRQRLVDWFELKIGVGGDLHRQVYYAWRDYPDAMRLTIGVFFMLGAFVAILSLIVFERFVR